MKKSSAWIPNFGVKGWTVTVLAMAYYYLYQSVFDGGLNTLYSTYGELYGWSVTQISSVVSLGGIIAVIGIAIFGAVCKKKRTKFTAVSGLLLVAVSFVIIGFSTSFISFAIGVIIYFLCATSFGIIGVGQFGADWFPTQKGMYMGMATMGITLSSATINLLMNWLIPGMGIKFFMLVFAAASVVVAILTLLFTKNTPEEAGCYPDNDKNMTREKAEAMAREMEEYKKHSPWTTKKLLQCPTTWKVAIGWSLPFMVAVGVMGHLVNALVSYGHDFMFGIIILSSAWPAGVLGNYIGGVIDVKLGTKKASIIVVAIEALGALIMALLGRNPTWAVAGIVAFMFAISANTNVAMSMTATVFGREDFENAWPIISIIYKIISSCGVLFIALVAENTSYQVAFFAVLVIAVIGGIIMSATSDKRIGGIVATK